MTADFARLSEQIISKGAKHKSSGSKHLELQKALKAQADRKAAEKRKSALAVANFKEFNERQEAQIKLKQDNMAKAQSQKELQLQQECSFTPKASKDQLMMRNELRAIRENEEKLATKNASKVVVPVLNLLKGQKNASAAPQDQPTTTSLKHSQHQNSAEMRNASHNLGFVSQRDNSQLLKSSIESLKADKRPSTSGSVGGEEKKSYEFGSVRYSSQKQSVVESLSVPVRQQRPSKQRYQTRIGIPDPKKPNNTLRQPRDC